MACCTNCTFYDTAYATYNSDRYSDTPTERGGQRITFEILGFLVYGGGLGWVNSMIYLCSSVHTIGISLFIIGCGMTIYRKLFILGGKAPNLTNFRK